MILFMSLLLLGTSEPDEYYLQFYRLLQSAYHNIGREQRRLVGVTLADAIESSENFRSLKGRVPAQTVFDNAYGEIPVHIPHTQACSISGSAERQQAKSGP